MIARAVLCTAALAPMVAIAKPTPMCMAGMIGSPETAASLAARTGDRRIYAYPQNGIVVLMIVPGIKSCGGVRPDLRVGDPRVRSLGAISKPAGCCDIPDTITPCGKRRIAWAARYNAELMRRGGPAPGICR